MLEPPLEYFYGAWNYAGRLTNIKDKTRVENKTPG